MYLVLVRFHGESRKQTRFGDVYVALRIKEEQIRLQQRSKAAVLSYTRGTRYVHIQDCCIMYYLVYNHVLPGTEAGKCLVGAARVKPAMFFSSAT